jgi:hypothetical protein
MATKRPHIPELGFAVRPDRPLIGVVMVEDGEETVRYFADEADVDAAIASRVAAEARTLAGAWADLDWDEAIDALDRIRHDSEPTPSIEAL